MSPMLGSLRLPASADSAQQAVRVPKRRPAAQASPESDVIFRLVSAAYRSYHDEPLPCSSADRVERAALAEGFSYLSAFALTPEQPADEDIIDKRSLIRFPRR